MTIPIFRRLGLFCTMAFCIPCTPALGREDQPRCASAEAEQTDIVRTLSPQVALNDYDGVGQTILETGFSHSQCIGQTSSRWVVSGLVSHATDDFGQRSNTILLGTGIILYPLTNDGTFSIAPTIHVGYERIGGRSDNFVFSAALGIEKDFVLPSRTDEGGNNAPGTIVLLNARAAYTDRRSTDTSGSVSGSGSGQASFFGSVGLDQRFGSRWWGRATVGYQAIERSVINGYATFALSARPIEADLSGYRWNFGVQFNLGDKGYRGVLFSISRRWARARR